MAEAFLTGQSGKKLVGNAVVGDVLSGKTFSNANSNKLTGTMPNRGKVDYQMPINGSFTIPAGYHNGTGSIFQSVTTKGSETFTPGTASQTVASGRYLTGTQTILGDANLVAGNIKNGVSIFGVMGSAAIPGGTAGAAQILSGYTFINSQGVEVTGTIPSKAAATYTPGTTNQTIAIGQYLSGVQTIIGDADLVTGNIKSGANIFGVAGKASVVDTADATATAARILSGYTGYVNGVKITGTIPSKAAATYTPGTSAQSISAGQYLSGAQTISAVAGLSAANIKTGATVGGVTGTYKGVGTATAARVLTGYTFSTATLSGASGTMVNRGAVTSTLSTQGASYTVPVGYHSGSGKVTASFSNLSAGNVKSGVNIGGVVGTYAPLAGYTWTKRTTSFGTADVYDVCYGQGMFVAVGVEGKLATSTDGITWTQRTSSFGTSNINGVCYGQGMFVAVGDAGKLATSTDGTTWTQRTSSFSTVYYSYIEDVCYGQGMFVAVGSDGKLATSTNGTSWTQRTSSFGTSYILSIGYGQGMFVAGGENGKLATSTNGITWTQRTSSFGTTADVEDVCYGQGMFVAGGMDGKLATSTNGTTWTQRTSSFGTAWINGVCYGQGMFVAGGSSGKIATSTDGITWTQRTSNFITATSGVCYGQGMFVAITYNAIATSANIH